MSVGSQQSGKHQASHFFHSIVAFFRIVSRHLFTTFVDDVEILSLAERKLLLAYRIGVRDVLHETMTLTLSGLLGICLRVRRF